MDSHLLLVVAAFTLVQTGGINCQSHSCPLFGEDRRYSGASMRTRLFINFDAPSQCSGTVTQWNYCYLLDGESDDDDIFGAKFMVYRESDVAEVYNIVPGSSFTLLRSKLQLQGGDCETVELSSSERFQIQPSDLISACIIVDDDRDIERLNIASTSGNEARQFNRDQRCLDGELRTIDAGTGGINSPSARRLHLHATIISDVSCRVGHNPIKSGRFYGIDSMTFLNREFPAECDGEITAWNYCYYTENIINIPTSTATVAVWRFNNVTAQYDVVAGSTSTLTVVYRARRFEADIYCRQESLAPENYIAVMEGDIIGVSFPETNSIPMLGHTNHDGGYNIWRFPGSTPSSVSPGGLPTQTQPIHLYADITPAGPDSDGLSGGGVAAIVIVLILLLVVAAVVTVVIVVIIRRKKVLESAGSLTHPADKQSNVVGVAFDNVNYTTVSQGAPSNGVQSRTQEKYVPPPSAQTRPQTSIYEQSIEYESVEYPTSSGIYSEVNTSNVYASIQQAPQYDDIIKQNRTQDIYAGLNPYETPAEHEEQLYSQIEGHGHVAMDINREDINFVRHLGSGQFGNVDQGTWEAESGNVPVAMKTLREGSSSKDKVKFLQEAVTMAQFRHPNVVIMYGMVSEGEPIILVVELIEKGDLRKNLLEMRPDSPGELTLPTLPQLLLKFSQHVALGMQYLSSKGFVHRDLAARNILLSKNNVCKIADFGLSRDLEEENYYTSTGGPVPVKWTAPEAIRYKKYSIASDVWSYGCVLYEIWSLGYKPFQHLENRQLILVLETGKRLAPPTGCPKNIYHLMIKCWHPTSSSRPSFRDTILTLTGKPDRVLEIPQAVLQQNPKFQHLGGPLEVGEGVYDDLHNSYVK